MSCYLVRISSIFDSIVEQQESCLPNAQCMCLCMRYWMEFSYFWFDMEAVHRIRIFRWNIWKKNSLKTAKIQLIFHFAIYILAFFSSLAILFSFSFFSNAVAVFIRSFRDELCAMHIAISICGLFSSHSVFSLKKKTNGPFFLNDFWWMRATKVCVKWKIEKKIRYKGIKQPPVKNAHIKTKFIACKNIL